MTNLQADCQETGNSFCKILRTWKVLENDTSSGKSVKFKLKVLECPGDLLGHRRNDMEVDVCFCVICSYSDNISFFATCDSDEHCSMDASVKFRITKCCLSLYLHDVGDYDRVLDNTYEALEIPANLWDLFWARHWEHWRSGEKDVFSRFMYNWRKPEAAA